MAPRGEGAIRSQLRFHGPEVQYQGAGERVGTHTHSRGGGRIGGRRQVEAAVRPMHTGCREPASLGPNRGGPGPKLAESGFRWEESACGFRLALAIITVFVTGFHRIEQLFGDQAGILADGALDLLRHVGIVRQKLLGVFTALSDPL